MHMKIAFLLYPPDKVKVDEDSSFWIMKELQDRGHEVFYFESQDLILKNGAPMAFLKKARLNITSGFLSSPKLPNPSPLESFQCIFIRKEPVFDMSYLYCLQILNGIKGRVFILNDPAGLALSNEKLLAAHFGNVWPDSLVTED